eukprot:GHVS01048529.1.p1 GENE.GHVS01048529.1~~GHVS01048529.1.p1  ORF type:complete len:180 (+),score=46.98 GHVS01048529.1:112-651(+)
MLLGVKRSSGVFAKKAKKQVVAKDEVKSILPPLTPSCSPVSTKEDFLENGTLQTNNMAPAVLWMCLHKQTRYVKKFNGVKFTTEPLNWTGLHCQRYCGLTNRHPVGVKIDKKKGRLTLTTKRSQAANRMRKPKGTVQETFMSRGSVKSLKVERVLAAYNPIGVPLVREQLAHLRQTKQQ